MKRLIDADALMKEFEIRQKRQINEYCDCFLNDAQNLSTEWYCVEDIVEAAPTIEAEPVTHCKDCKSFKEYTPEFKESAECVEGADGDCFLRLVHSDGNPQFSAVREDDYCSLGAKMDLEG